MMFERLVTKKFLRSPRVISRLRIFETFLIKTYKVRNTLYGSVNVLLFLDSR